MKSFLIAFVCVFCCVTWVKGDAAGDLIVKGTAALGSGDYAAATAAFDQVITNYPSTPSIDQIRLQAGFAYLHMNDYVKAVDRLAPETLPGAKDDFRGTALYYTALAQLAQGGKETDKAAKDKAFTQAGVTFTTLIDYITKTPNNFNKDYLEDAIYNRALSYFQRDDLDDTEKDLLRLTSKEFATSLRRPDYLLLLGSLYFSKAIALQTAAQTANKMADAEPDIRAMAAKAIAALDQAIADPNALVSGNEATLRKADILYFLAPLDLPKTDGYQKALETFRLVHRKDDLIPLQQQRVTDLRAIEAKRLRDSPSAVLTSNNLVIDREQTRLTELQAGTDPIIEALIRIADSYNAMKQGDEARTVLHRLVAHAKLTPDQQKDLDFQVLYSYVLGGQTDKADKALTDYLAKHAGDPQADYLSYQMAADLFQRKEYPGALAQAERSRKDFPTGRYIAQVISLQASILSAMGKPEDSAKVIADFVAQNPKSDVAMNMMLTNAANKSAGGDFAGALVDYNTVKTNGKPELQASAAAGAIQALQKMGKTDDVIAASQDFAAKFPDSPALPAVLVMGGVAMDQKKDPGAVAALQAAARKYPNDVTSPFALYYVVNIYQRANNPDKMVEAAAELAKEFPTAYALLAQAADAVSDVYVKQKKFPEAIAQYQLLVDAPKPEVAAAARNKIGTLWIASAKSLGSYQSQKAETRPESEKRLASAEDAFIGTLKMFPTLMGPVGDAFQGLVDGMTLRRSWGLLTDATMEDYLTKVTAPLDTPEMQARIEMAKAGLVFVYKDGGKQYQVALDRDKKVVAANADLILTRQEANQYGELLIWSRDYAGAQKVYDTLLATATPTDELTLADGYYGKGAAYLAAGDPANAKIYFQRMKKLNQGAAWHPHIIDADYGLAFAAEGAGDDAAAKPIYAGIMRGSGGFVLKAKAMLGYGRLLEKAGAVVKQPNQQDIEYATNYYTQVDNLFGPAVPALSAEGLYDAGQAMAKAGDKVGAKAQYQHLIDTYAKAAPEWATKAQDAMSKL